jgi:hypothetical protein
MTTPTLLTAVAVALTLSATWVVAQDRAAIAASKLGDVAQASGQAATDNEQAKPAKDEPTSGPSGSPNTSGDTKPSAADPAEATKTGANPGEGASYSRSNDKGDSALPKQEPEKK